jgi:predicted transcriptional regulator
LNAVSVKFYKREFTVAVLTIYANLRLVPVTVLYFNQRGRMGEKHKVVYSVRFLPRENLMK